MRITSLTWFSFVVLANWTLDVGAKQKLLIGSIVKEVNVSSYFGIKLAHDVAKISPQLQAFMNEFDVEIKYKSAYTDQNLAISWVMYWLQCTERPLLLLGPETLKQVLAVTGLAPLYREIMVSYQAIIPPALNNKFTVSLASTSSSYNRAKNKMMEHFGWKRAAILYDLGDKNGIFTKVVFDLTKTATFDVIGIEAINTDVLLIKTSLDDDTQAKLQKLKEQDTKIFFAEFGQLGASLVFCERFKLGLFGPGYVWIISREAGAIEDWVRYANLTRKKLNNTETCTRENYKQVLEGTFFFDKYDIRADVDTPTDSGMSVTQLFNHSTLQDIEESKKIEVPSAFDAAWTVFLAMKNASVALRRQNITLNDTRKDAKERINHAILEAIKTLSFEGLTGPVSFNQDREREGVLVLKQMRESGSSIVPVGQHLAKGNIFKLYNITKNSLFKDNRIPRDSSLRVNEMVKVSPSLFIVFSVASCIGTVLGIIFLVFNQYYRKYKFIRLSAPLFNDIIVLGCILCLSTVILFGLRDVANPDIIIPRICKARAWILTIGFSMAFGAMFVKTWRIYKICTNKRLKVRLGPLSDCWMLAMVGGIILIDAVLLTAWEIVDPLSRDTYTFESKFWLEHPDRPYVIVIPTINTCTAKYLTIWLTLIYVYKGILLLYGLFLSYETRNVVYAHLNDSRVIGICVYNVVVLSTIGAFLALILTDSQYEQLYAALSVCITFPATATISLIFIPKVIHLIKVNSLEGEIGPSTMDQTWHPSIDNTSVYGFQTEIKREKTVDRLSNSNTLQVYQKRDPTMSSPHTPPPPVTVNDNPAMVLED